MRRLKWAAAVLLIAVMVRADLRICGHCGYEAADEAVVCSHCGASLPAREVPAEAVTPPGPSAEEDSSEAASGGVVAVDSVDAEMAEARRWIADGQPEVARAFMRNAAALCAAAGPAATARARKIAAWLRQEQVARTYVTRVCLTCEGTGKRRMSVPSLSGETTVREVHGMVCKDCQGTGTVKVPAGPAETRVRIAKATQIYRQAQQVRGYEPVGTAWVPPGVSSQLTVDQEAALRRMTVAPCSECLGSGKQVCARCDGSGTRPCRHRGCRNGWIETEVGGELTRSPIIRREKCPECHGKGVLPCADCGGGGMVACKACGGSGMPPLCRACDGTGIAACRRCGGSGTNRGERCTSCSGSGKRLCSSCDGSGHRD